MYFIVDKGIDKSLFGEAYDCNLKLICLGNNDLRSKLITRVNEKLGKVKITSTADSTVNINNPGLTKTSVNVDNIVRYEKDIIDKIEMFIYDNKYYTRFYTKELLHTNAHELFHMFSAITPGLMKNNRNVYYNGDMYINCVGSYSKYKNGDLIEYGKMFSETLTDLLTTISLNTYSPHFYQKDSANKVLKTNQDIGKSNITGYTLFTSMTRLAIAAFNNDPNNDYDLMLSNGQNLFFSRIKGKNEKIMMKNDLLYGYLADPLHTKREFEKVVGEGSYDKFMGALDEVFEAALDSRKLDKNIVKKYMKILPSFLNLKLKKYREQGVFSEEDIKKITYNFNRVWNETKKEYGVYFTKSEINELYNINSNNSLKKIITLN